MSGGMLRLSSLRTRLILVSGVIFAVALAASALGLVAIFSRQYEARIDRELETYAGQLVAALTFAPDGSASLARDLADPRFSEPLSGLYWMVVVPEAGAESRQVLRSRSLWDAGLDLPADDLATGTVHRHELPGPTGTPLIVRERLVVHPSPAGPRRLRVAVAVAAAEIEAARRDYTLAILPSLGLLGLALLAAAAAQAVIGLRPLSRLARDVAAVGAGRARQLPEDQADEVMPLVRAVNELLREQENAIAHARARASDLAHGLKTPLTVLASLGERLRRAGQHEAASDVDALGAEMRRQIDHQLALARIRSRAEIAAGEPSALAPAVEAVVKTLRQTPRGEEIEWSLDVAPDAAFRIDRADLTELLGNLIENAFKWATSRVTVRTLDDPSVLEIADDGPGMAPEDAERAFGRGVRLDERRPGHGLGLSIVAEICAANGIDITTARAADGGLAIRLSQSGP